MIDDILKVALQTIRPRAFQYRKYTGRTVNSVGSTVLSYSDPVAGFGIVEPGIVSSFGGKNVGEKDYADMGLDWSKSYITVWIRGVDLSNIYGDTGTDQVIFNNKHYNVIQVEDWLGYENWKRCYCVEVTNES